MPIFLLIHYKETEIQETDTTITLPLERVGAKNLVCYSGEIQDTSTLPNTDFGDAEITEFLGEHSQGILLKAKVGTEVLRRTHIGTGSGSDGRSLKRLNGESFTALEPTTMATIIATIIDSDNNPPSFHREEFNLNNLRRSRLSNRKTDPRTLDYIPADTFQCPFPTPRPPPAFLGNHTHYPQLNPASDPNPILHILG
ncbi:hypothetical protein B9Z19DRAFT_1131760 [Tuber borchii]|uniref:Uncharacterized protein n=1 Tax=Tuber borchii TaxID=42251 RepID=A0A2T6ZI78_TUBBO|nr:hypothetical protein B9Z19DRAFT_1131760 [Tuber borchii]